MGVDPRCFLFIHGIAPSAYQIVGPGGGLLPILERFLLNTYLSVGFCIGEALS